MSRILVIEDEAEIQEVLYHYLTANGYEVELASDGVEGLARCREKGADLILLDVMLPKIDGFAVLELIRRESEVPVIIVTARDSVEDQVHGFDLRVDDYVPKPFDMPVLLCKIAAVLRRTSGHMPVQGAADGQEANAASGLCYGALRMEPEEYRVFLRGEEIELTMREFELLRVFLENEGRVFTRQGLLDAVWGIDYFGDERIVDTHIKNLRKKLGNEYIQTVRGVGYRIEKRKR